AHIHRAFRRWPATSASRPRSPPRTRRPTRRERPASRTPNWCPARRWAARLRALVREESARAFVCRDRRGWGRVDWGAEAGSLRPRDHPNIMRGFSADSAALFGGPARRRNTKPIHRLHLSGPEGPQGERLMSRLLALSAPG